MIDTTLNLLRNVFQCDCLAMISADVFLSHLREFSIAVLPCASSICFLCLDITGDAPQQIGENAHERVVKLQGFFSVV